MNLKKFIRNTLIFLHLDITKNLRYDRLTSKIMHQLLKEDSNCIDIGCHKGEILKEIIHLSPRGKHLAFEPLPHLFQSLTKSFDSSVTLYPYALAEKNGHSTFNFVKNAPAYSGINKRKYDIENPEIQLIEVELKKLDDLVPENQRIHLVKIDVEGGELNVMKGGLETIKRSKPYIIFECGIGASDYYGTTPEEVFSLLVEDAKLSIATLDGFLTNKKELSLTEFSELFNTNKEYYFIAFAS